VGLPRFKQEVTRSSASRRRTSRRRLRGRQQRRDPRRGLGARQENYEQKEKLVGRDELLQRVERDIMLQIVDVQWKDHLYSLDHLKEGIGLRGYGQRDPLVEYKRESFQMFQAMKDRIDEEMVRTCGGCGRSSPTRAGRGRSRRGRPRLDVRRPVMTLNEPGEPVGAFAGARRAGRRRRAEPLRARPRASGGDDAPVKTMRREEPKVGRNDPCPCGSGKKYKKCHGAGVS
jgi:preprotein translocase subunit SecA